MSCSDYKKLIWKIIFAFHIYIREKFIKFKRQPEAAFLLGIKPYLWFLIFALPNSWKVLYLRALLWLGGGKSFSPVASRLLEFRG